MGREAEPLGPPASGGGRPCIVSGHMCPPGPHPLNNIRTLFEAAIFACFIADDWLPKFGSSGVRIPGGFDLKINIKRYKIEGGGNLNSRQFFAFTV